MRTSFVRFQRLLWLAVFLGGAVSCGTDPSVLPAKVSSDSDLDASLFLETGGSTANGVDGVSMAKGSCDTNGSANPSILPSNGSIAKITVSFCVTVTIKNTFAYDAKKWGFVFGSLTSDPYVGSDEVEVIKDDAALSAPGKSVGTDTTTERKGTVSLAIKFKDGRVPSNILELWNSSGASGGRKSLRIFPFYSDQEKGPQESTSVGFNVIPAILLQEDQGALKAPPGIGQVTTGDESFVVELSPPTALTAEFGDPSTKRLSDLAEKSTLQGYLLMYWNYNECKAQGSSSWQFDVNPNYDAQRSSPENYTIRARSPVTCDPPTNPDFRDKSAVARFEAQSPCSFGCSTTESSASFFERPVEKILQPKVIPKVSGKAGRLSSGCYTVVKVDAGAKSFGIDGLTNEEVYGIAVFSLDGSGRVGYSRSACRSVQPSPVPLASVEKGAETKDSDCFVVTAASGSTSTRAVHVWRVIRDAYLMPSRLGSWFVKSYYRFGPAVAHKLEIGPTWLKKSLHTVFDFSGRALLSTLHFVEKITNKINATWKTQGWTALNPLSASQAFAQQQQQEEETTAEKDARLPASSHLYVLAGISVPTEDKDLYKAYYPTRKPFHLVAGQTFTVLDLSGELGVGAELSYLAGRGKVPKEKVRSGGKIPEDKQGRNIGYYALGIRFVTDYNFRIDAFPYVRPRVTAFIGAQKFREQSDDLNKEDEGEKKEGDDRIAIKGAESWSTLLGARVGLQTSLISLFGDDSGSLLYSYGIQDFAFHLQVGYAKDLAKKTLSTSGIQYLGGFAFLFL